VERIAALLLPSARQRAEEGVGPKVPIQRLLTGKLVGARGFEPRTSCAQVLNCEIAAIRSNRVLPCIYAYFKHVTSQARNCCGWLPNGAYEVSYVTKHVTKTCPAFVRGAAPFLSLSVCFQRGVCEVWGTDAMASRVLSRMERPTGKPHISHFRTSPGAFVAGT